MKTLVLGIGNSILGDDGIGVHVVLELAQKIRDENIDFRDISADGLNLLDTIMGYDKLIVIDAILRDSEEVGEIYRFKLEDFGTPLSSNISPHHGSLSTIIEFGKKLFPNKMPKEVVVFAVGTQEVATVTEEMTAKVMEAIPKVTKLVMEELVSSYYSLEAG